MKPTKTVLFFIVIFFTAALWMNSAATAGHSEIQEDTTSISYWKTRARNFELLAHKTEMMAHQAQMSAREEAHRSKKINDESQAKIRELTAQLEECKKGKP